MSAVSRWWCALAGKARATVFPSCEMEISLMVDPGISEIRVAVPF